MKTKPHTLHYKGKVVERVQYMDVGLDQSINIIDSFPKLFDYIKDNKHTLSRILEIGSNRGGLTFTISELYGQPIETISYDIDQSRLVMKNKYPDVCKANRVDFRLGDCFSSTVTNEIKNFIQNPGLSLVLCDGGHKCREFNTFTPMLKDGDIIMLHDYADTPEDFKPLAKKSIWLWHESTYAGISRAVEEHKLTRVLRDEFKTSVWGVFQK
jgi:cephalosporin hydroxylase